MLKLVIGMPVNPMRATFSKGFTLIEILVVLVIASIVMSFALLSFGDFGEKRKILIAANQFAQYIQFIKQQAILENKIYGIRIESPSYRAYLFTPPKSWRTLSGKAIFAAQYFPKQTQVMITPEGGTARQPQITIDTSGDISPFQLTLSTDKDVPVAILKQQINGKILLTQVNAEGI